MNPRAQANLEAAYRDAGPEKLAQLLTDAQETYVKAHDARNLLIALALADGWPTGWIADKVSLSRQRIQQFKANPPPQHEQPPPTSRVPPPLTRDAGTTQREIVAALAAGDVVGVPLRNAAPSDK